VFKADRILHHHLLLDSEGKYQVQDRDIDEKA
jgi:hypothetical protein